MKILRWKFFQNFCFKKITFKKSLDELNWEADFELSEEEQARLLEEYEQEIKDREGKEPSDLAKEISESEAKTTKTKPLAAASKKPTNVSTVQKKSQKTSTLNNNKNNNNKTNVQSSKGPGSGSAGKANTKNANKSQKESSKEKPAEEPAKDELKMEKDHFNKEENSSTNSDESWTELN